MIRQTREYKFDLLEFIENIINKKILYKRGNIKFYEIEKFGKIKKDFKNNKKTNYVLFFFNFYFYSRFVS